MTTENSFWQYANQLQRDNLRVFLFGPTRSGKTQIAGGFPRPVFVMPTNENSEETLRGRPIPFKKVSSMREMDAVLDVLGNAAKAGQLRSWCDTVVVDNLTHYHEIVELELTQRGTAKLDWGAYAWHFKRMKDILWSLDAHVVLTALSITRATQDGRVTKAGVDLAGKTANLFPSSCDVVAYTEMLPGPQWVAHVQQYGLFNAGTRVRGMPHGSFANFTFSEHIAPYLSMNPS